MVLRDGTLPTAWLSSRKNSVLRCIERLCAETASEHRRAQRRLQEVEEAITRVIAGPEKKSRVLTEKDKMVTAYHEVGHAICAKVLPHCDEVHEISIIPRGMAAGYTMTLPDEDESPAQKM